ncbi:MAG: F0F1 ATP synthase subunit delta [Gammaproteobacteria bacterium]|nr:F0F1 ATP synthase subunit delta [Gammaproteobacteria bacterium]
MRETATLARPYARAAFEQARSEGKLREWSDQLALLSVIAADPLMRRVIRNPRISAQQLAGLVADLIPGRFTPTGRNFVGLLVDAGRLDVAPEIRRQFEQRRLLAESRADVEVIAAFELDDEQRNRIRDLMQRRLGREVTLSATVDQSLIGGAIIRTGDYVIDASVRGRLRVMGNQLSE